LRPLFAKSGVKIPGMMLFVGPIILYLLRELLTAAKTV